MDWYIADDNVQKGPFRLEDLPAHGLRPDSLVWKVGMGQWERADAVAQIIRSGLLSPPAGAPPFAGSPAWQPPGAALAYAVPGPSGPLQQPPPFNPANSNRIAAGVCAILLGGFGVHKFILGMPTAGIIMLLVSVLGGFFTCGLASIAISVIAFVEGIIYLTRTEEQFYYQYVVQKREWF